MPGPLSARSGKAAPPRPPPLPCRPGKVPTLRRLTAPPAAIDGASALPVEVVRALRLVAAELRDMPRDCARDREELVHWHGRLARRLDAVVASKARAPTPAAPGAPSMAKVEAPIAAAVPAALPPILPSPKPVAPAHQVLRHASRPLPVRTAPATRWRARPADAAFRRRAETAGQLRLTE